MYTTLGASSGGRFSAGQAGVDSSAVRAITPGNVVPGWYSVIAMVRSYLGRAGLSWFISSSMSMSMSMSRIRGGKSVNVARNRITFVAAGPYSQA